MDFIFIIFCFQYVYLMHQFYLFCQDHIVSAVLLTKKDTFLTREQYNQLLYSSGLSCGSGAFSGKPGKKVSVLDSEDEMQPLLPAIWKPEPLWSGKQVFLFKDHFCQIDSFLQI